MSNIEIKPMGDGISFMDYLGEILTEYGEDFAKMLCENKLNIESERSVVFELITSFGKRELKITLRELQE